MSENAFRPMEDVERKQPLGHTRLNEIASNLNTLDATYKTEHLAGNRHNSPTIPTTVGKVSYGASGPYSYAFGGLNTSMITGLANPSTGLVILSTNIAQMPGIKTAAVMISPHPTTYHPTQARHQIYNDGGVIKIAICITQASQQHPVFPDESGSATWGPVDCDFSIAIFCKPLAKLAAIPAPSAFSRGTAISSDGNGINRVIENMPRLKSAIDTSHTSVGKHTGIIEHPKLTVTFDTAGHIEYYSDDNAVASVTLNTVGPQYYVDVGLSVAVSLSTLAVFAHIYPIDSPTDEYLYLYNCIVTPSTPSVMRIYAFEAQGPWTGLSPVWSDCVIGNPDAPARCVMTMYYSL